MRKKIRLHIIVVTVMLTISAFTVPLIPSRFLDDRTSLYQRLEIPYLAAVLAVMVVIALVVSPLAILINVLNYLKFNPLTGLLRVGVKTVKLEEITTLEEYSIYYNAIYGNLKYLQLTVGGKKVQITPMALQKVSKLQYQTIRQAIQGLPTIPETQNSLTPSNVNPPQTKMVGGLTKGAVVTIGKHEALELLHEIRTH